jgi:murein DD-endopeptidase MepM/ murein hydrolase activator NlpD
MIRIRGTTIPVVIASFVAGALTAVGVILQIVDHASTDQSVGAVPAIVRATPSDAASETTPREVLPGDGSLTSPGDRSNAVDELRRRGLLVPVAGVEARDLRSTFQEARAAGRTHEAIDILAPRNTVVRAVSDGEVEKLFFSKAGGLTIYQFDTEERYAFYYAHLERYAPGLREGDDLHRGETIGFVGTSGNAPRDTPHLHFAIFKLGPERRWWQGDPIDPFAVFRP